MIFARLLSVFSVLAVLTLQSSGAESTPRVKGSERPVYHPDTKSYFELRLSPKPIEWQTAKRIAEGLDFKGTRGRLAIIESPKVHNFLYRNFITDEESWIGLRYWCTYRKLQWVDGTVAQPGDFGAWSPTWYRTDGTRPCEAGATKATGYMSVYVRARQNGFKWQAVGSGKKFYLYFVEYPTGKE